MQIIEESIIGVRSAVIAMTRRSTPLRFVLFPMIHTAEPGFYREVKRRLRDCRVIVAEGSDAASRETGRPDPRIQLLTLSYRLARHNKRLGVETQNIDYEQFGVPVFYPDMEWVPTDEGWKTIPLAGKAAMFIGAPLVGAWLATLGTREGLGKHLELDDLPNQQEERLVDDVGDRIDALLLDGRDELLVNRLVRIHEECSHLAIDVGVVYGAQHMRAVSAGLNAAFGYRPRSAEWITVLAY